MTLKQLEPLPPQLASEAASLFKGLINNELFGVYVIQDGRFVYANHRLAEIFGYVQDEVVHKLGPLDLTDAADQALAQTEIDKRVTGSAVGSHYTFKGRRKDGSRLDVEVFGSRTEFLGRPAIAGLLLDATARCDAERAMQEQLNFTAQLLETIPNPVYYKDAETRFLGCNKAYEEYLGIARQALIGRTVHELFPPDLAQVYAESDRMLFASPGFQTYEATVRNTNGVSRDVAFYKATFNKADGSLGGLVGVVMDITERKRSEEIIWRQANYDSLTGLPNRRLFHDRLELELKKADRSGHRVALLFIDLDRFKEVNDALGHSSGDLLLEQAAHRVAACARDTDTVARLGGDEFTVILGDLKNAMPVERVVNGILDALAQPFSLNGEMAYVSASIGITFYPRDAATSEVLIKNADQAMYAAKNRGRNGFCYFTESMQERAVSRLHLGNDLRIALAQQQLEVFYQPILDLATGRIVKAEALLRWRHPERGMVSPALFIPVAEELGLINSIGDWVFEQAAQLAGRWHRAVSGLPESERYSVRVAVNKSPRQFTNGQSDDGWLGLLDRLQVPAQCLAVEITEGLLLDERPEVGAKLRQFRDAGMQVSLDDFGTGYSAMAYLKRFAIDILKIDQSFVRDLTTDPGDLAISEAIIAMAHKLGIRVVAEGIETEAQRRLLTDAGCDFGQGYLFARPLPTADFWALLNLGPYEDPAAA